jgi:hypothetical protein
MKNNIIRIFKDKEQPKQCTKIGCSRVMSLIKHQPKNQKFILWGLQIKVSIKKESN